MHVAKEELWGHMLCGQERLPDARRHHHLTQGEIPGFLQFAIEDLDAGLQHGERAGGGILHPALPGTVGGGQEIAVTRLPRFLFGCRHGDGESYASGSPRLPVERRLRNWTSSATILATPRSLPSSSW